MCSCDDVDYSNSFEDLRTVTARKEHSCCECGLPIETKEKYIIFSGHGDGEFFRYKRHEACHAAAESWSDKNCRSPFGALMSDLFDCDLEKPTRDIWAKHLWRFRKNPRARKLMVGKRRKPWNW